MGILGNAPQRPLDAWKKQKENQHEGQCLGEEQPGVTQQFARCLCAAMQADQCGGKQGAGTEQPKAGGNVLCVEVMGQQEEEAEHDDDQRITSAAHFQLFECHEKEQQGDAGIATKQGAEFPADPGAADDDQEYQ